MRVVKHEVDELAVALTPKVHVVQSLDDSRVGASVDGREVSVEQNSNSVQLRNHNLGPHLLKHRRQTIPT